ncbi:hypothetical protein [Acidiphilium acidophilum]|uniref:hypothetical protein n=1 Tax=Acidiphilium acidophilum TaxID=76588 RepID=UPI002E8E6F1C|nr:hypothetical protein [Acidiphilium acidophilum]
MNQRLLYARRLALWVFEAFPIVWLTLVPIILAFIIIGKFGASEPSFRVTGMAFQIVGLVPIFISILDLRRKFELPRIIEASKSALQNRPKYNPPPNHAIISGGIGPVGAGISAYQSIESEPDDPLDKQIEALRSTVKMLRQDFEQTKKSTADTVDRHQRELGDELQGLATQLNKQADKLKSVLTTGLTLSASGTIWIAVGIIMSSMSIEWHRWL